MFTRRLTMFSPIVPLLMASPIALWEEPSIADRVRGNYENKIRFFANPEKIFETFSNGKDPETGETYMTYEDFFHSVTPYSFCAPLENKKNYFDSFTPEILKLVDADGDKRIDFNEYIFFITMLQLPEGEIMKTFQKINPEENKVTKDELKYALKDLRKATALGHKQQNKTFMPDGRKVNTQEEEISKWNKKLLSILFEDKEFVTVKDFMALKRELKIALLHYEFHQFEVDDDDTISAEDFAKSLLSTLSFTQAHSYMKRIHDLDLQGRVNFKEYVAFHGLIEKADIIKMKISVYRFLNKTMFRELCDDFEKMDDYCKDNKVSISDTQIDVFMKVLDDDQNGMLEYEEVIDVLEGKKNIGLGKEEEFKNEMIEKFNLYYKKFQRFVGLA